MFPTLPGSDQPDSTTLLWLALQRVEAVGPVRSRALLDAFGSVAAIFSARGQDLAEIQPRLGESVIRGVLAGPDLSWARDQALQAHQWGAGILHLEHPEYPACLQAIAAPPPVLFAQGVLPLVHPRAVAVVGTRCPSALGTEAIRTFASDWAQAGLRIVSGLAHGIDSCAHQAALDQGGQTLAVLGCPLDALGTGGRGRLAQDIARHGLLVTEHCFGSAVKPGNFVRRNRLISGLSQAVVVAQAPEGSGALLTAKFALEQDRELLCLPGPAGDRLWQGNFDLLRQGATLCADSTDLLATMGWDSPIAPEDPPPPHPVVKLLRDRPSTAEELALQLSLPMNQIQAELALLELSSRVRRIPGGRFGAVR